MSALRSLPAAGPDRSTAVRSSRRGPGRRCRAEASIPPPPQARDLWDGLVLRERILLAAASRIDDQLAQGITLQGLCRQLGLDARSLTAAFKQAHGLTMSRYLLQFRCRCLHAWIAQDPRRSLAAQLQRCGLSGTPSERRMFRTLFQRTIEGHAQACQALSAGDQSAAAIPSPSALTEALQRLDRMPRSPRPGDPPQQWPPIRTRRTAPDR
ncbi:MAG: AraC family transcriptional regulator [Synechococcaceae cyanobacterium]|nr:AraC family transcriptional regulator [Synechococcaceae cyanobacterium]